MKGVRSLREMTRLLDTDLRLRRLCLIKPGEAGYPRSVLSRFIRKVGEDNLTKIIEEKVVKLLKRNRAKDVDVVFDASFIKAWSTRHPMDNHKGARACAVHFDIRGDIRFDARQKARQTSIVSF